MKINHVWETESGLPTSKLTEGKPAADSPISARRDSHWLSLKPSISMNSPHESGVLITGTDINAILAGSVVIECHMCP